MRDLKAYSWKRERVYVRDKCANKDCSRKLALQQRDMSTYLREWQSVSREYT